MATLTELMAWRDTLERARFSGHRTVRFGDREVTYRTDGEMAAALSDLERQIGAASGTTPIRMIRISSSKGL